MHIEPAWTPDGKEIVFVSNRDVALGSGDLWRMPVRPGRVRRRRRSDVQNAERILPRADALSHAARCLDRRQAHYLFLDRGRGRPVRPPVRRAHRWRRALQADLRLLRRLSTRAGRPTASGSPTFRTKAACRSSACSKPTAARENVAIRERRWKRPMGRIHVRVTDEKTGAAASRVRISRRGRQVLSRRRTPTARIGESAAGTSSTAAANSPPKRRRANAPSEASRVRVPAGAEARVEVGAGQTG